MTGSFGFSWSLSTAFLLFLLSQNLYAAVNSQVFRGAEAQAMGGAVTATINDDLSLFYNPAGLGGAQNYKFRLLNANLEVSDALLSSPGTFSPLLSGSMSSGVINSLIGENIYARTQAVSEVSFMGFAMAAIGDIQGAVRLQNPNYPTGTVGLQTTYGAQLGYGQTIAKFAKKQGELRFGVAGKYLMRAGAFQHPSVTDILTLNMQNILGNYQTFGLGIGFDSGMQLLYRLNKKWTLLGGIAVTDLGNTVFSNGSPAISSNLSTGFGVRYKNYDFTATLSYDFQHVLDDIDWQQKTHMGLELKFPILSLYAGLSQLYPSYGFGLDFKLLKVLYTSYTEELGSVVGLDPEHRYLLNVQVDFSL
jgi:hypothetical protein